jgi:acyl carrier protein
MSTQPKPTAEQSAARIREIISEELGVDLAEVTDNADLVDDLGGDSLDTVELVMAFEEEFGIELPADFEDGKLTRIGDLIPAIQNVLQT